jgi:acyl-CoA hydrolase
VARERDSEVVKVVAEGEFTFVALDGEGQPREIFGVSGKSNSALRRT